MNCCMCVSLHYVSVWYTSISLFGAFVWVGPSGCNGKADTGQEQKGRELGPSLAVWSRVSEQKTEILQLSQSLVIGNINFNRANISSSLF